MYFSSEVDLWQCVKKRDTNGLFLAVRFPRGDLSSVSAM